MQILSDGTYVINDVVSIESSGTAPFVFGQGWLLEILHIESGEFCFYHDSVKVSPRAKQFGIFYPPFTFVRLHVKDLKGTVRGVGHTDLLPELPASPILFDTDFDGCFTSVAQASDVIAGAENVQSIEPNSNPSLLSIRTKRLIDENYLDDLSIAGIARRLNVSHAHVSRQFKRDFEMTPSQYLHQLRVAEATFRLSVGEPIIDISHDVGYNDLSRFYKQFRRRTRTSPAACRETLRG